MMGRVGVKSICIGGKVIGDLTLLLSAGDDVVSLLVLFLLLVVVGRSCCVGGGPLLRSVLADIRSARD